MPDKTDLSGLQFGEWIVLEYVGDKKWKCKCSCGEIRNVHAYSLTSGRSISCGNKSKHTQNSSKAFKDLTGQQFGVLTVIEYLGNSRWKCKCSCGKYVELLSKNIRNHKHDKCNHSVKVDKTINKTIKTDELIGHTVGDLTVIQRDNNKDDYYYICKCKCGKISSVKKYSLTHPNSIDSYKCKHKLIIGQRFGKLIIKSRFGDTCNCQCDCGNTKDVWIGNLLNGTTTSCGCSKLPTYSKEEVLDRINNYIKENNQKPFIYDIMSLLDVKMTAAYEYIDRYNIRQYLNSKFSSSIERDIYNLVNKYTDNIELHTRKIISPLELDIYIPEKKIAIEINGTYWHSINHNKDEKYHQNKTLNCAKNGIRLIHIFEYEWKNQDTRIKIENYLKDIFEEKELLQARKLSVQEVSIENTKEFLNKYHLQGYSSSTINLGLYNNTELISIMTFGKPRFDNNYNYEIIRYCTKYNKSVIGGAERLFKTFLKSHKNVSVVAYSDLSKFTGDVYNKLGFRIVSLTEPNYMWVNKDNHVLSRYQTQKSKLIANKLGTEDQTEDEIMINLGYYKIYNSGNLKFEYI